MHLAHSTCSELMRSLRARAACVINRRFSAHSEREREKHWESGPGERRLRKQSHTHITGAGPTLVCVVLICCTPIEIGARRKSRLFIWRAPAPPINISAALVNGVKIELLIKRARQTGLSDHQLLSCLRHCVLFRERENVFRTHGERKYLFMLISRVLYLRTKKGAEIISICKWAALRSENYVRTARAACIESN